MKVLVAVKRVLDYNAKPRVKPDGSGVDLLSLKMSINPFDEIAIEEAVKLKEAGIVTEVVLVSVGTQACQDVLRTGLALGADRAILVDTDIQVQPLGVAKALKAICEREQPKLLILGKQAIDGDACQTGQMVAALLGWPQATFASKVELSTDRVVVTREVDGGLETRELLLPSVITTDLRLNTPRYASLPNIMKAKKKPLESLSAAELSVDLTPRLTTLNVCEPPARKGGVLVADVKTLIEKLRFEAKVI